MITATLVMIPAAMMEGCWTARYRMMSTTLYTSQLDK